MEHTIQPTSLPTSADECRALAAEFNNRFAKADAIEVLRYFMQAFPGRVALGSSLSYEDQVLTQMMCATGLTPRVFTLDTGRLFPETYNLIERTNERYGIAIEVFFPDWKRVQDMVRQHGVNLFYKSVELRHECCNVRKIEPLHRALQGVDVWVCGLRREQSVTRTSMQLVEYDEADALLKLNPLIDWTEAQLLDYVRQNAVPYNPLHRKGYPSIGCQPCTRAVVDGEDPRSGRWWWERPEQRECGLHVRG